MIHRLLALFACSISVWAQSPEIDQRNQKIKHLAQEFLAANLQLKMNSLTTRQRELAYEQYRAQKTWNLVGEFNHSDENLDTTSVVDANYRIENGSLGITRSFPWGGELGLEAGLTSTQLTNKSPLLANVPSHFAEFYQTLSYSQDLGRDFFGQRFAAGSREAEAQWQNQQWLEQDQTQTLLARFYHAYAQGSLALTKKMIQEQALERAQKREQLIARRVRDGLREEVDLYRAQMAVLSAQENVKEASKEVAETFKTLADLLGRGVSEQDVEAFQLQNPSLLTVIPGELEKNKRILALKAQVQGAQQRVKMAAYNFNPGITMATSFKTNDFDTNTSESIRQGFLSDTKEWTVGLNLSFPLGLEVEKRAYAERKAELLKTQMGLEQQMLALQNQIGNLNEKVDLTNHQIRSVQERLGLARKALKSQNRLYDLGRVNLDTVIGAEEDLLQTENSLSLYLVEYHRLFSELSALYGNLHQALGIEL